MADLTKYTDYKTVLCVNILIFSQGKVLMVKRPLTKKVNPGKYSGIGGKVEPGESYLRAAQRELQEETGLDVVSDLKEYVKILAQNQQAHLLGQFIFDQQDKLIEKKIQVF